MQNSQYRSCIPYRMTDNAQKKTKRRQWDPSDMEAAMEAVQGGKSVSAAAEEHSVPRKTLDDRVKGHVVHGSNPGPSTVLTSREEDALASYLIYMAERGFPLTSNMARAFAWAVSLRSGASDRFNNEVGPGKHWWKNFRARHPQLTLRTADNLERSRANALTKEVVDGYFDKLKHTLEENGLVNTPRQLFNCDETFLPLNISCEKVVAKKNAKHVYARSRGTTEHITLLCGASAAGIALPPMIIFAKSFPGGAYKFNGPDDALYAKSDSGWIDSELFMVWMKKIFLRYCGSQRPVLLFVDGHASHITIEVIDFARENQIILFCLPPHTTHALQPLDVSVFKSLKSHFSKAVHALSFSKRDFVVSKREFARVVKTPFEKAFSMTNIKAGFAKCGIHPFDPNSIDHSKILPSSTDESSSTTEVSSDLAVGVESSPNTSVVSMTEESMASVNPSPIVSSLSSAIDDGSPQVPSGLHTSTPVQSESACSQGSSLNQHTTTPRGRPSIQNPLVRAGLIPQDLADIFLSPQTDEREKRPSRRITGVRVLTSNDYVQMMKEKDQKEKEASAMKEQRKKERERKKIEKEQERERKKAEREEKKGRGKGKGKRPLPHSSSEEEQEVDVQQPKSRRSRRVNPPDRYRVGTSESEGSDTECCVCNAREPPIAAKRVFWVDCDLCGEWAHTHCALGSNTATRRFSCEKCCQFH